ncbi:MAG: tRNA pseudouridine(55) synthase TruB [Bacilli bacterium]|jgi:tRNA pseudouridine55 synthase
MDGILLVDKPSGYTSRDIVNIVGKLLNTKKIGHTGTLDPIATGVLVLCIGRATKLVDILVNDDKEYIAEITIGIETDTLDIEGKVIKQVKVNDIDKKQVEAVLTNMIGEYEQEVPIYSAIKVKGKKLYDYARSNEKVTLPKRLVNIKTLELTNIKDNILTIKCQVSKGTYIRSLVRDIGLKLGYPACMSSLRRIRQGIFKIEDCYTMENIKNKEYNILRITEALKNYPIKVVDDKMAKKILNGMKLDKFFDEERILLIDEQNEALAIYERDSNDKSKVKPLKILKTT